MPQTPHTAPIEDSVSKVNQEIAVGEDLDFQKKWWRFERAVWVFFTLVLVLDLAGVFGRGPVAHAQREASDQSMRIHYDRIARAETPSILDVAFDASAIHNNKVQLFVSESLVKELGTQRVVPQPESTAIGNGGLTYTFPATNTPAAVQFALQPSNPGLYSFVIQIPGSAPIQAKVAVMP